MVSFYFGFLAHALNFAQGTMYKLHIHLHLFCCQMTTAIAIEDVRREVKILRALNGHSNLVQFYDAFEDQDNVYIAME